MPVIPSPPKLCPYRTPETVCSDRCALFVIVHDGEGKVIGGNCTHYLQGIAMINLDQTLRTLAVSYLDKTDPLPAGSNQSH